MSFEGIIGGGLVNAISNPVGPPEPGMFFAILPEAGDIGSFPFTHSNRVAIEGGMSTVTIPQAPPPTTDPVGSIMVVAFPDAGATDLTAMRNIPVGVDEVASWPFIGLTSFDGTNYAVHGAGPLIEGSTFNYEATIV